MPEKRRPGRIDYNGSYPQEYEIFTAIALSKWGYNVKFVPVSRINGVKTPDVILSDGLRWEIKAIESVREQTVRRTFNHAIKQSPNIIFDLSNLPTDDIPLARQIVLDVFPTFRRARRLKIITPDDFVEEFEKPKPVRHPRCLPQAKKKKKKKKRACPPAPTSAPTAANANT